MPKEIMYKQCRMERVIGTSKEVRTSWIPEKFAVENKIVKIRERDDSWSDGWKVTSASGEALPEKLVVHRSHDHTRQRKASDI
jgi:hypothetical protein